jgi:hypothetical protein
VLLVFPEWEVFPGALLLKLDTKLGVCADTLWRSSFAGSATKLCHHCWHGEGSDQELETGQSGAS